MNSWTVTGLVVAAIVLVIAAVVIVVVGVMERRSQSAPATGVLAAQSTRRQVINRGIVALFAAGLSGMAASALAFVWPALTGRSARRFDVGTVADVQRHFTRTREPYYNPIGRFYLVPYPADALGRARQDYGGPVLDGMEAGYVALSQRCTHQGCRVPWCASSEWFECPCHGSRYNRVGEQRHGPAPRGLDRFDVVVDADRVTVDTTRVFRGPRLGTDTTGDTPAGPHCS
jgi:cytochrome b6-f complex iron-sulfur subunit